MSIEGWLFDTEGNALQEWARGKRVLELGCWKGRSTVCMAQTASHVFSVDWFKGNPDDLLGDHDPELIARDWRDNTRHLRNVDLLVSRLGCAYPTLNPNDFGFVFYDADHSTEAMQSFVTWLILHEYSGALAVHDYNKPGEFPGTQRVMDWFKRESEFQCIGSLLLLPQKSVASVTRSIELDEMN